MVLVCHFGWSWLSKGIEGSRCGSVGVAPALGHPWTAQIMARMVPCCAKMPHVGPRWPNVAPGKTPRWIPECPMAQHGSIWGPYWAVQKPFQGHLEARRDNFGLNNKKHWISLRFFIVQIRKRHFSVFDRFWNPTWDHFGPTGGHLDQHWQFWRDLGASWVNFGRSRDYFGATLSQGGPVLGSRAKNIDFRQVFTSSRAENVVFLKVSEGPRILGMGPAEAQRTLFGSPPSRALTIKTKENWTCWNFNTLSNIFKRIQITKHPKVRLRSLVAPQGCRRIYT